MVSPALNSLTVFETPAESRKIWTSNIIGLEGFLGELRFFGVLFGMRSWRQAFLNACKKMLAQPDNELVQRRATFYAVGQSNTQVGTKVLCCEDSVGLRRTYLWRRSLLCSE